MTIEEFRLPDVGEGVAEGELVEWLVAPGDRVEEGQPIAEVETDKALVEVPSRYDGVVEELFAEAGDVIPVGDVIISFRVDESGETGDAADADASAATDEESPDGNDEPPDGGDEPTATDDEPPDRDGGADEPATASGRTFAPPSARRLARELGVDVGVVDGSGPGGRVTEADVRAHAEGDVEGAGDDATGAGAPAPRPAPTDVGSGDRKSAVHERGGDAPEPAGATGRWRRPRPGRSPATAASTSTAW
ncbi:biotin/lipoyl-containing protein [Halorubrum sp. CBA1125]|uniref:biotin/lipoyl-containing protein n=1 Tax=Halorubrum sp. CBA1125 TaxID=2668072 RepID=UPI0018D228A2|nr:biotin/lipoyl-containing protein [Halorubrum sp. CBA1125]